MNFLYTLPRKRQCRGSDQRQFQCARSKSAVRGPHGRIARDFGPTAGARFAARNVTQVSQTCPFSSTSAGRAAIGSTCCRKPIKVHCASVRSAAGKNCRSALRRRTSICAVQAGAGVPPQTRKPALQRPARLGTHSTRDRLTATPTTTVTTSAVTPILMVGIHTATRPVTSTTTSIDWLRRGSPPYRLCSPGAINGRSALRIKADSRSDTRSCPKYMSSPMNMVGDANPPRRTSSSVLS